MIFHSLHIPVPTTSCKSHLYICSQSETLDCLTQWCVGEGGQFQWSTSCWLFILLYLFHSNLCSIYETSIVFNSAQLLCFLEDNFKLLTKLTLAQFNNHTYTVKTL